MCSFAGNDGTLARLLPILDKEDEGGLVITGGV